MIKWKYALQYILNNKKQYLSDAENYSDEIIDFLVNLDIYPLFKKELDKIKFNNGDSKVIKNIDAEVYTENDDMKDILAKHIISPVRFSKSLENMIKLGVDTFIEIGPGKTLSGFAKKIKTDKEIRIFNVTDVETLKNVLYQVLEKN